MNKTLLSTALCAAAFCLSPVLSAESALTNYIPTSPVENPISEHRWEIFGGIGYKPYSVGPGSGHTSPFWGFNGEGAYFFTSHWGIAGTGRGYFGTAHVNVPNSYGIYRPTTDEYMYMGGPEYRYARNEHLNLSLHAFVGAEYNQINGNIRTTSGEYVDPEAVGVYKDQPALGSSFGGAADFAVNNHWAFRIEPEVVMDDFKWSPNGGGLSAHFGASAGVVYRMRGIHHRGKSY
ncbi:outer membrane beta-barrel protein [Silvibacterium sp.]|uniref:outer membrane beta-barrel protein n=1 Tax=Silvibacterium sp. TaxID=1964179 RepID=UPI0039E2BAB9